MKRRDFCIRVGGTLLAIPTVLHIAGCGGDDDDDDNGADAAPATSFQGSGSGSHSHSFTVQCADLSSASDVMYTSSSAGHTHAITLTVAQLGELAAGNTVTFDTNSGGHSHSWTVAKPSSACG